MARRALIVANKWWEADPLIAVLSSAFSAPSMVSFIPQNVVPGLRGHIEAARGRVEVWCIQELMSPSKSGSNTEEKVRVLAPVLAEGDIVLVVAFGTAATPTEESYNGCVTVGTRTFCHDPEAPDTRSHWIPSYPDVIVDSPLGPAAFQAMTRALEAEAQTRLLPPPINPAAALTVTSDYNSVALSDINVTNYKDYVWADQRVTDAFLALKQPGPMGSLETTHAVIRACTTAPFMFVSGITDRAGYFDKEVSPAPYGQNFVAAHNAAIAAAWMIPAIASTVLVVS